MLKTLMDFHCSEAEDIVADKYLLHLSSPIEELHNDFVKYYLVTDIDSHEEYYGIVFKSNFIPDFDLIYHLKTLHQSNINGVISYGVTRLSYDRRAAFVVVVPKYDIDATFASALAQGTKITKDMLQNRFLPMIANAILFCKKHNAVLGNICSENILLRDDGSVFIREPFIAPNNFYQEVDYLSYELVRCNPYARGSRSADDVYALGVLSVVALSGVLPTVRYSNHAEFMASCQEHGSYKMITNGLRFTDNWRLLMRGMLNDNIEDRWSARNIIDWCSGNMHAIPKKVASLHMSAYITFNGKNYISVEGLLSALCNNWDKALVFIGEEKFHRWLNTLDFNDELQQQIEKLCTVVAKDTSKSAYYMQATFEERNRILTRMLMILGNGYILHTRAASYSLLNFSQYLSLNMAQEGRVELQALLQHITQDVESMHPILEGHMHDDLVAMLKVITVHYKDDKYAISGMEKLLYMLCPNIACQSPLLSNNYVYNIPTLLVALDLLCHNNIENFKLDRHITAFIASKLDVKSNTDMIILKKFPNLADDPLILGLPMLSMAHAEAPEIEIVHLVHAVSTRLIEIIDDNIHNQKLQKTMIRQLLDEGENGDLESMLAIISDSSLFENDLEGYNKALESIKQLKVEINEISQMNMIYSRGVFSGQKLTVLISYILCLAVIVILMI